MSLSLPSVPTVRNRIAKAEDSGTRLCLMTTYLFAARISEVVGKVSPSDTSTLYGVTGLDVEVQSYEGQEVAVFSVKTAKRKGKIRKVALPLGSEPWAKEVLHAFDESKSDYVFPFTRQQAWLSCKPVFKGLTYPIMEYTVFIKDENTAEVQIKKVEAHSKPFRLHALRHLRATELVEFYGFDGFNLALYGGWTLRTAAGLSSVMERYLSLGWQSYIPKLLKMRRV